MSLEWFDRVSSEMQDYLQSICEQYDEIGHIRIERAAKHPKIECYVEYEEDDREVFCTLFFDPNNEEFYMEEFDIATGETYRQLLPDIEDIIDAVHEVFHEFIGSEEEEFEEEENGQLNSEDYEDVFDDEYDEDDEEAYVGGGEYEVVVDVEWTSPEVLAYSHLDEVEVTYKFGIIKETGDGILHRINRIFTEDQGTIEDETNFIFSKEEAGTIIELIEENMDRMEGFDPS